jgi:hypothetical protein
MKVGNDSVLYRREIPLPVELVSHILSFLSSDPAYQTTFWSCCLVSRLWYSAAVSKLYEKPILWGRNFDAFASIVCPPVSSHVRHVGFETYVNHLDMGSLTYESSNGRTARLLRRVGPSLNIFVAPPVSFS